MPGGSSNGWAGDRMGDLPHNLHKKQRTKSMSYTALHGEPGPWERQFEHPRKHIDACPGAARCAVETLRYLHCFF